MRLIKVGLIGFGRMGEMYLKAMQRSGRWEISHIVDISADARSRAAMLCPEAKVSSEEDDIFSDPSVEVVGLFTLANSRKSQIIKAVRTGKNILCEKPVAATEQEEAEVLEIVKDSPVLRTVNLFQRSAWYHEVMKDFIASGQIGDLAIVRLCHMTPGLAPGEGHEYEGPSFHDCGMHYLDIARWYAGAEYATWHAQGIRMWDWEQPWWIQSHGTFTNGVVFDITQGFVYGQLSKDQTHNSYVDIIGTKGIVRMNHDFKTAVVELRGVDRTEVIERPYGGKNLDVLLARFADSMDSGVRDPRLPDFEDACTASKVAMAMIRDAFSHDLPSIGDNETLVQIRNRRSKMTDGYGLLKKR